MIRVECEHGRTEPHPLWDGHQLVLEEWPNIDGGEREWVRCDRTNPACDLEVVRPGKVQCSGDYDDKHPCGQAFEPKVCEPVDVTGVIREAMQGLTLSDNMGDVADELIFLCKELGWPKPEWDESKERYVFAWEGEDGF